MKKHVFILLVLVFVSVLLMGMGCTRADVNQALSTMQTVQTSDPITGQMINITTFTAGGMNWTCTDTYIGLPPNGWWSGGLCKTPNGYWFDPEERIIHYGNAPQQ